MNRKARRAGAKLGNSSTNTAPALGRSASFSIPDLMAQANWRHQHGGSATAETICQQILAREPSHVHALNLLGLILQETGRPKAAANALERAVASDPYNSACHYNLANSYQALGRRRDAATHFTKAITLGLRQNNIEKLILQSPMIAASIEGIATTMPPPAARGGVFSRSAWQAMADDIFLQCALITMPLRGVALERFLTFVRAALLDRAYAHFFDAALFADDLVMMFTAVAQQCFINEYVFVQSDAETRQSLALRDLLSAKSAAGEEIGSLLLASVAAYVPLHSLPEAQALAARPWPHMSSDLVRQTLREPLEEIEDSKSIPTLSVIDDDVSLEVMRQYEENPYPRWTIHPLSALPETESGAGIDDLLQAGGSILIAGCGSGQHCFEIARRFAKAKVLAIDISLPSLAYARRKTREAGLGNIEYAKADILRLASLGRSFDRIEVVGVLHHLADPEEGWRALLSLLQPNGTMRVGLYSETARRSIASARAYIADRGYKPTIADIRQCRQDVIRNCEGRGWMNVIETPDFYNASGCRDLLFNVIEHRFTIWRIKAFLDRHGLSFLGFEREPWVAQKFQEQFEAAALTDLDAWSAFEAANPLAFRHMYVFSIRKSVSGSPEKTIREKLEGPP